VWIGHWNFDPGLRWDKRASALMVQGKDWQAVPHRLQNLHAERIPQAGEQESIGPLIKVGQFIPWSCAKEFHPVLNLQVARSVFPWAAHFAIARDQ
jgi:hypothetical protein